MTDEPTGFERPSDDGELAARSEPPAPQHQADDDAARPLWQPPAYGLPPSPAPAWGTPSDGPERHQQPPLPRPFPGGSDLLESPPRRRRGRAALIAVVVLVLVLVAAGGTLFATSGGGARQVNDAAASRHATPTPTPQRSQGESPSPGGPGAPTTPRRSGPDVLTPPAATGPLDWYLLKPTDVGPRALMLIDDDGRSVTDVATLDYCGRTYPSDSLRDARVQVQYGTVALVASNEFVRYQKGGAAQAFSELKKAMTNCPSSFNYPSGGAVSQAQTLSLKGLSGLAADNAAAVEYMKSANGTGQWNAAVYQFDGNYFSGVYTYGTDKDTVVALAKKLAPIAAVHLREAAAGKPGTGGGTFANLAGPSQPGAQA